MHRVTPVPILVGQTRLDFQAVGDYLNGIECGAWAQENFEDPDEDPAHDSEMLTEVMGRLCYKSWLPDGQSNRNVTKIRKGNEEYVGNLLAQRDALIARGIKAVLVAGTYGTTRSSIVLRESAWNSAGKKKCGATKTGILVDNSSRGKRGHEIQVCTSRDCTVHNKGRTPSSSSAEYAKWQERQRREDEARDAKRKREEAIRWEVLNQIATKVPTKPAAREWTILFDYLKDLHRAESVIEHFKVDWKKPGKAKAVAPCIVMLTLLEHVDAYQNDKVLRSIAKKYGVNYNAAIKAIDKKRKAAAMGAPPAPKDGKYEEPTCTKCGCTETSPCDDGCAWLKLDKKTNAGLCTACGDVDA